MNITPIRLLLPLVAISAMALAPAASSQRRGERLPSFWIRDNMQQGFELAKKTNKPLLIVFRCPP